MGIAERRTEVGGGVRRHSSAHSVGLHLGMAGEHVSQSKLENAIVVRRTVSMLRELGLESRPSHGQGSVWDSPFQGDRHAEIVASYAPHLHRLKRRRANTDAVDT
jgi:hypothetical protein